MATKLVQHKKLRPHFITGDDWDDFMRGLIAKSDRLAGLKLKDFNVEDYDKPITLDPGGMLNNKEPWIDFEINGHVFTVQPSKASLVLHYVRQREGKSNKIDGYRRFLNWRNCVCVEEDTGDELVAQLEIIAKSDAAIHGKLDMELAVDELVNKGVMVRRRDL